MGLLDKNLVRSARFSTFALLLLTAFNARAQVVTVDWTAPTAGVSIDVDAADNVFTASYAYALGAEIQVTKRDVHGNLLWEASVDQTDNTKWERASWVAVDSQGDVLVCGTLMSGYSNPVEAASILLKFRGDGTPVYRLVYESSFDGSYTKKCLVDELDDVYVLGMGSGPNGYVTKIKKFTPDGVALWTWYDAAGIGAPTNFKLTPDGALLVSCRAIFGALNGHAKVDRDGNLLWSLAGVQSLTVGDAAGDVLGNSYLVHGEYATNGGTVVRKLDGQGVELWQGIYPSSGFRIEVGSDDMAVVSGFPDPNTAGAAFFKVDPTGALVWSNLDADGPLGLLLHARMVLDSSDNAYLAAGTLFEMAVCKVRSDGSSAWTATMPGGYAWDMVLGQAAGSVFVVGGATARLLEVVDCGFAKRCNPSDGSPANQASLDASGCDLGEVVTLRLSNAPPGQFAYLLIGNGNAVVHQPPGSAGDLCIAGGTCLGRYAKDVGVISAAGEHATDISDSLSGGPGYGIPTCGGQVRSGETWSFQYWHRQPMGLPSTFSEALAITFR